MSSFSNHVSSRSAILRFELKTKSKSEKLIIAIIGDNYLKFQFKQKERSEALEMLDIADLIVCLEGEELIEVVKKIKPKVLVLGKEKELFNNKDFEIQKAINLQKTQGGKVEFRAGDVNYASADLFSKTERQALTTVLGFLFKMLVAKPTAIPEDPFKITVGTIGKKYSGSIS